MTCRRLRKGSETDERGAAEDLTQLERATMAALQLRETLFRDMLVRFTNVAHTYAASRSMLMKPLGCA